MQAGTLSFKRVMVIVAETMSRQSAWSIVMTRFSLTRPVILAVLAVLLSGCALLKPFPPEKETAQRLAVFPQSDLPLRAEATIYWNEHQIPYIHAQDDEDLPLLLGMVHAHLRLGQMELLRHVSQGRLAELFGPPLVDIDHSLRLVDFGRPVEEILLQLPPTTRTWLERYAEGINFYSVAAAELPPELAVMGIKQTLWSAADILTVGRLASTDVNWLYWFFNMRIRDQKKWPELWKRMIAQGQTSHPSFTPADGSPLHVFETMVRSGSNAVVIAGSKSRTGSALMAGDPHLGLIHGSLPLGASGKERKLSPPHTDGQKNSATPPPRMTRRGLPPNADAGRRPVRPVLVMVYLLAVISIIALFAFRIPPMWP